MLVEDDDIGGERLHPPVLLGLQHLPHQREIVGLDNLHQHDRQIARDAVRPEPRLPQPVAGQDVGAGAQRRVEIHAREARRSKRSASSLEIPRWRWRLCSCTSASAKARELALESWYLWASAIAASRETATPVANDMRTKPPAGSRMALAQAPRSG